MGQSDPPPDAPALPVQPAVHDAEREMRRLTRRSFAVGGAAALVGLGGWYWLRTREREGEIPWPLRRVLDWNGRLGQAYFKETRLAPTFSVDSARDPRINGKIGMERRFDPADWRLQVENAGKPVRQFSLGDILALPRVDMVTELKCIEGWSEIVHWAGARFSDLLRVYRVGTRSGKPADPPASPDDLFPYVQLETPGGGYYVGLEMASALHPQTLLCYEMNGQFLTMHHGAPLRLVTTIKYGIKSIKRIGRIRFLDERPADFWADRGYDWYAGH
jgi:DMSO/TMAO reductase YedYZ molybdopterin-dependent catalytic subunit